jgi:hypothetical protein
MARRKPVDPIKANAASTDPNSRGLLRDVLACLTAVATLVAAILKFVHDK